MVMKKETIRWIIAFLVLLTVIVVADIILGRFRK